MFRILSKKYYNRYTKFAKDKKLKFELNISLEEESLAQWAVRLVTRVEPLADASDVELVFAVFALHTGKRTV